MKIGTFHRPERTKKIKRDTKIGTVPPKSGRPVALRVTRIQQRQSRKLRPHDCYYNRIVRCAAT